jgi:hypothetical protein
MNEIALQPKTHKNYLPSHDNDQADDIIDAKRLVVRHKRQREDDVNEWHRHRHREPENVGTSELENEDDENVVRNVAVMYKEMKTMNVK